jgi:threonine/homoserine/homoserine lactone efflux protein
VTVYSALISFALIAGLLTIIPGIDTALVVRAAVSQGRRAGFATALGIGSGTLVWGAASAIGVSALLTASRLGYDVLRLAGAGYLLTLGATMVWRSRQRRHARITPAVSGTDAEAEADYAARQSAPASPRTGLLRMWSRGMLTNLLNPKVGVFYVAMLPQVIPASSPHLLMGLALAGVHDVEGMIWFTMLIGTAHRARRWLNGDRVRRYMDCFTGTVLVAFGLKLALSRP